MDERAEQFIAESISRENYTIENNRISLIRSSVNYNHAPATLLNFFGQVTEFSRHCSVLLAQMAFPFYFFLQFRNWLRSFNEWKRISKKTLVSFREQS